MKKNHKKFYRKSIRLKDFDYSSPAAYFVTICIDEKKYLFGEVKDEEMILNLLGEKVKEFWLNITEHYDNIMLDEFVIMPDHIHGIIAITDTRRGVKLNAGNENKSISEGVLSNAPTSEYFSKISPSKGTLSVIVRTFKSAFTTWCRKNDYSRFKWQRGYYDRIIRDEKELDNIRQYIAGNPSKWTWDKENQNNIIK